MACAAEESFRFALDGYILGESMEINQLSNRRLCTGPIGSSGFLIQTPPALRAAGNGDAFHWPSVSLKDPVAWKRCCVPRKLPESSVLLVIVHDPGQVFLFPHHRQGACRSQ